MTVGGTSTPGLPTVAGPGDAAAFVSAQVAHGADYLKIYLEDPAWYGSPALSAGTVRALVAAAHAHDMLAIAHADSPAMARMFIQAGGDALAHVLSDLDLTPAFLADLHRRPAFVIATLTAPGCTASRNPPRISPSPPHPPHTHRRKATIPEWRETLQLPL
jgi:imidazolonepropionase-like amidohydrolase